MTFKIVPYQSSAWKDAVELRETVLRKPLGSHFTEEELKEEADHIHVVAYLNDKIVATAALVLDDEGLKMQRVAVNDQLRNRQIGSKMMAFCESYAINNKVASMYCHARNTAVKFYSKNGYHAVGDYFDEDGIPHLKMIKTL